jgi:hypothetical protein
MAKSPKQLTLAARGLTDAFVQQDGARDDLGPVSRTDFDWLTTLFVKLGAVQSNNAFFI